MEKELEGYLHKNIPLSLAMGVGVKVASSQKVVLTAPFANNINHKKTVFGGSLHAVATLACWGLLYVNLKGVGAQLVITHSQVDYQAPVSQDFEAECKMPSKEIWEKFTRTLSSKGKARIELEAIIVHQNKQCVYYRGVFAALGEKI